METTTSMVVRTYRGTYSGHPASFRSVKIGAYVAICVTAPERTAHYALEVYVTDTDGIENFLGYEPEVCVHPGDMMHAINYARPVGATVRDHAAVAS